MSDLFPILDVLPPVGVLLLAAWLLFAGGSVGSFLNVVVYRLPTGRSLMHPPSRCPQCLHPIRWYDNIPVLSWLRLRGRCRDCGAPIAFRYPLVEALVALLFVVLALGEPLTGGANLPYRPWADELDYYFESGSAWLTVWSIYAFHLLLLCTLFTAGLIEWDRRRLPWRLLLPAALIGIAAPFWVPALRPLHWHYELREVDWAVVLRDLVLGVLVGGLMALLVLPAQLGRARRRYQTVAYPLACLPLVGIYLGWQAVPLVAAGSLLLVCLLRASGRRWVILRACWTCSLTLVTLLFILTWRPLAEGMSSWGAFWPLLPAAAVLGLALTARALARSARGT